MKLKLLITFFVLLITCAGAQGQKTSRFEDFKMLHERAFLLFENKNYNSAQKEFEELLSSGLYTEDQKQDAQYFVGICRLKLNQEEAYSVDYLKRFVDENPTHPKSQYALYEIANHYFENKKFQKVTEYLNKVNLKDLESKDRYQGRFRLAYSYFELKDYAMAENNFDRVKNQNNKYKYAANYYSGYIKLKSKKYKEALSDFEVAEGSDSYKSTVPVMISNIYYNLQQFDKLIDYADKRLSDNSRITNKVEIYGLLGEAYFEKSDFVNASKWYSNYTKSKKNITPSVRFKYGLASYKQEDYKTSAEQFKYTAGDSDSLEQTSAYYLGNSYLKQNENTYALNAFKQAANSNFNTEITQNALFTEAKIFYKDENYSALVPILERLLDEYPDFSEKQEANNLITESYVNNNDYKSALKYIENLKGGLTDRQKAVYQQVANQQAINYYNSNKHQKAIVYFDKSIKNNINDQLVIESMFWKAESHSNLGQWKEAINTYATIFRLDSKKSTPFFYKSFYGIGYAYFNTQQYEKAKDKFEGFLASGIVSSKSSLYTSSLVRIGDCILSEDINKNKNKFRESRLKYKEAIDLKSRQSAYSKYAIGLTYFYENNSEEALVYFKDVIDNHKKDVHYESALFQRGYISLTLNKNNDAVNSFSTLIKEKSQSKVIPETYYYRARAYQNKKDFKNALKDYDYIINNFCRFSLDGKTALASDVITDLDEIVLLKGISSKEYMQRLNKVSKCVPELDIEYKKYDLAKNQLYEGMPEEAINSFNDLLIEYPNSKYVKDINYYLGEAYYNINELQKAKGYLEYILANTPDNFYLEAVYFLAKIAESENDYDRIKKYNAVLVKHAQSPTDYLQANIQLMKSSYHLEEYSEAISYSKEVNKSESTLPSAANDAMLYQAKSYYMLKDTTAAKPIFAKLVNSSPDQFGAESQYFLARIEQDNQAYQASTAELLKLNKSFSAEKYWVSKSFLMIGDNYVLLKEDFQARATYESIIQYSSYEDVVLQAKEKLLELELKKAKQDSLNIKVDTIEIELGE